MMTLPVTLLPVRFTVMSLNLWADNRMPERTESIKKLMVLHQPDILCLQELRPTTRDLIDLALPSHQRINDPFEGWIREGNIYYNTTLFNLVEYGAEDIGMFEVNRRLFWSRLSLKWGDNLPLFVSTAHYTWSGNPVEREGGVNPRYQQAQQTVKVLSAITGKNEPILFMGDLNDYVHPVRILREDGFVDSFSGLGRTSPITIPAIPTAKGTPQTIDWIFHRGPLQLMTSEVVDFFEGDIAPSDHKPILATYSVSTEKQAMSGRF